MLLAIVLGYTTLYIMIGLLHKKYTFIFTTSLYVQ